MSSFADINVSQGSVATYARCGGMFNIRVTANLQRNLPVKSFVNRLWFDRVMVMSLWPRFLAHRVCIYSSLTWVVPVTSYSPHLSRTRHVVACRWPALSVRWLVSGQLVWSFADHKTMGAKRWRRMMSLTHTLMRSPADAFEYHLSAAMLHARTSARISGPIFFIYAPFYYATEYFVIYLKLANTDNKKHSKNTGLQDRQAE